MSDKSAALWDKRILINAEVPHPPRPTARPMEQDRWLNAAVAYARYLSKKHPTWSGKKIHAKVQSHYNIKFV